MPNIKVVIWSAAGAAILALIAGLFGRVSFLDLVVRTFIGGAVFGLFGAGVSILLKRFVPEIFDLKENEDDEFAVSTSEGQGDETQAAQQGNNLNIVLDGDEYSYAGEESGEQGSAPAQAEESSDADGDEEFVEELEEVQEPEQESENAVQQKVQSSSSGGAAPGNNREFEDIANVDTLPDLEEFSDSFESVAAAQDSDGESSVGGGYSSQDSIDIMGDQQDPATVAKAVRTIISKDQEG